MTKKGYNDKHQSISRAVKTLLLLFICLVSCQNEKENLNIEGNEGPFNILPVFHQAGIEIGTKALISGYSLYEPNNSELIYAWAQEHTSGTALSKGEFRRSNGHWYSSVEVEGGKSYYMFAFQPGGICTTRGDFAQSGSSFTLSVNPIDILTLGDPTISIAAARSYCESGSNYNDPTPTPGNFNLGEISNTTPNDKVLLAMNHLYSKVDMSFTLHEKYSKLRTIVITSVKMVSTQGSSSMNLTFGANPSPNWGSFTSKNVEISLPIPGDSIVLSASNTVTWSGNDPTYTYHTAGSFCYLPKSNLPVELEVTYNVYTGDITTDPITNVNYKDRLVRKDQTARNGSILPSGTGIPRAGTSYAVKINVVPSYLYQLSDEDIIKQLPIE